MDECIFKWEWTVPCHIFSLRQSRRKRFSCGRRAHCVTAAYVSASTPTCWHQRVSRQKQAWHCGNIWIAKINQWLYLAGFVKVSCYSLSVGLKGPSVVIWQVGVPVFNLETFFYDVTASPKCIRPSKIPFCNKLIKWMKSSSWNFRSKTNQHTVHTPGRNCFLNTVIVSSVWFMYKPLTERANH